MRCLILIAVVISMAAARPEMYKEKEDFQYSRSSSDDGSKSGYYGAQRGNMGGNYERAHNMDTLAQHQMSGLVHQVDGEIGDTSNANTGSVFTAANSRGMYGSGHYDLSNLEGRNFQEGMSLGDSHTQNAFTNTAYRDHAAASSRHSSSNSYLHNSRHSTSDRSEHEQREQIQRSNLRAGESLHEKEYDAYDGTSSLSWSPYQNRLVSTRPMKILIRPGTRVIAPISTQTYDAGHSASSYDASAYNQQVAKNDAEVIINNDYETNRRQIPVDKHYESSYSYQKEWEKHHSSPGAVPLGIVTDKAIPRTSELYDDAQHTQAYNSQNLQYVSNAEDSLNRHSSHAHGYNSRSNLASSSQFKQQSDYDVQRERLSSDLNAISNHHNTHQSNFDANMANQEGTLNKPKSYQSSYSYHKSWERQGDPYVIVPVPDVQNGQASQRLSAASTGYSSNQYDSHRKQSHQSYSSSNGLMGDCDDEVHKRVARSYNLDQEVQQNEWDDFGQQSQQLWGGQQTQNLEDLGQQTEQKWDRFEDLGQQTEQKWDKIEDLGQQTQSSFNKLEEFGQQAEQNIENLGQETQTQFDKIETLGQKSQNQWDQIQDLTQQTQNQWDQPDLSQQSINQWSPSQDLSRHLQNKWDKIEDLDQHSQSQWNEQDKFDQQSQRNIDEEQPPWEKNDGSNNQIHFNDLSHNTDKHTEGIYTDKTLQQNDVFLNHNTLNDHRAQHSSSVNSLWDKLDRLSGESTINTSYNTNKNKLFVNEDKPFTTESITTEKFEITTELKNVQATDNAILQPKNIGRGDIPDTPVEFDKQYTSTENLNVSNKSTVINTDKTQQIEALSLSTNHDNASNMETGFQNLGQHDINIHTNKLNQTMVELHDNSQMDNINMHYNNSYQHNIQGRHRVHETESFDQENLVSFSQFSENYDQQSEHNTQQNIEVKQELQSFHKPSHSFDQDLVDFSQFSENSHQQSEHKDQQNMEQELQSFDEPSHSFDQDLIDFSQFGENSHKQSEHKDQQNREQELQSFDKSSHSFDQDLVDFSQFSENAHQQSEHIDQHNMEHEVQSFDKPKHSFDQDLVDFSQFTENAHQQSEHIDQQNMEQVQSFDKPKHSFDQDLVDLSQFRENSHQQSEHIDQKNTEQELQSFDKPSHIFDQDLVDFSQFSENSHQQSKHIDQKNTEQELQSFDKPSHSFGQELGDFNQFSDNSQQQSAHIDHQNTQQELQSFDKFTERENRIPHIPMQIFDQQNEYQNIDLGKLYKNIDQQNGNIDQQNMGEEQDMQNFGIPVEINEHQNLNQNSVDYNQFYQSMKHDSKEFSNPKDNFNQQLQDQKFIDLEKLPDNFNHHNFRKEQLNNQLESIAPRENFGKQSQHEATPENNLIQKNLAQNNLEQIDIQTTIAPEPEKTGFWSSVGQKFSNAKDKVASWFKRKSD